MEHHFVRGTRVERYRIHDASSAATAHTGAALAHTVDRAALPATARPLFAWQAPRCVCAGLRVCVGVCVLNFSRRWAVER